LHPTYEKRKIREAVESFLMNWRNIGLSRTFKSYVMAVHSYETMRRWGINNNGDSFIKQCHQIGIKDDNSYCEAKNFEGNINFNMPTSYAT
jgi:hypothetical protein